DTLREHLLALLREQGYLLPQHSQSAAALQAFLSQGFFLLQTLKWPLADGRRGVFGLTPAVRERLLRHTARAHLRRELALCAPQHIVALGNAAWQACTMLSERPLPLRGVGALRSGDYQLWLSSGPLPLNVTYLPVPRIMTNPRLVHAMRTDFE